MDAQVKKYLTKERQFLRKQMVCMHISGEHSTKEAVYVEAVYISVCCHAKRLVAIGSMFTLCLLLYCGRIEWCAVAVHNRQNDG